MALALSDGGFGFSPIFYIAPFVRARISFWAAPVAKTFRVEVVIEFQDALAKIDGSSPTGEPNLYQYLDQVAPIFQQAVPTITVSIAPPDEGLVGWKAMIYHGPDIDSMSHL
jgi:hypothetical protein